MSPIIRIAGAFSKGNSATFSMGGSGGAGGVGKNVDVLNSGSIVTHGENSYGILAQSVGGGGGSGGFSVAGSISLGQSAKGLNVSLGGSGGDSDVVDVTNDGIVVTEGWKSHGIYALSLGGGGGIGGFSATGSISPNTAAKQLGVSVGGFGGAGGHASKVTVSNSGTIVTDGERANAIYAQSIGGGGGDGGSSFAGTISVDAEQDGKSNNLAVAVGGFGGAGNSAGEVTVNNNGVIDTSGNESHAIYGHSIGGGGGNGGSARTLSLVLGLTDDEKKGLEGDEGGDQQNTNEQTADDADKKKKKDKSNKSLEVAVGGTGGEGGTGGTVTITNDGKIVTRGADAHGIFAQSIGGGGGTGGNGAHGVPDELPMPEVIDEKLREQLDKRNKLEFKKKLDIVVGGNGGFGNDASTVTIRQTGDIATLNNGSYGLLAQSIGAGGGVGGNGAIGKEGKIGIGGGGGAAGDGGEVNITMDGNIDTVGVSAHGIFAQSIGGGGGIAGNLDFGVVDVQEDILDKIGLPDLPVKLDSKINNMGIGVAWGRDGGSAGHGGNVIILSDGHIITRGDAANGIFAQSVGGGGGLAGNNGFGLTGEILNKVSCIFECNALTGSAGGEGSGGEIDITHTGNITTFGDVSHGIFAQSAGGVTEEGEVTNHTTLVDDPQLLDENSNPSLSSIFNKDSVTELLLPAIGDLGLSDVVSDITGQMKDDYKGFIDNYLQASTAAPVDLDDVGKDVRISVTGDVIAHGANSHGIFAQSIGGDGNGNIDIKILGGIVQGGTESGAAIRFKDGAANTLLNEGTLMSINGVLGNAVIGGDGNETIDNSGNVIGIVNLGAGMNTFNNNAGAQLNSGATIALGSGVSTGRLTNHGTLSPGGVDQAIITSVTGDLLQTDSGRYLVDLDMSIGLDLASEQADRVTATGSADLAGLAEVNIVNPGFAVPGTRQYTILSGEAGVTESGLELGVQPSAVMDYELLYPNSTDVVLSTIIDFSPHQGLNRNQRAIGEAVNTIQGAGGSAGFAPIAAELLSLPDEKSIGEAYNKISPESYDAMMSASFEGTQQYTQTLVKRMHSIRSYLDTTDIAPGTRQTLPYSVWIDGFGESGDQDADNGFTGFDYSIVIWKRIL